MRRFLQLSVLSLAVGAAGACKPDEVVTTENIPTAGVRFINAVPDTNQMDMRFVDFVENNVQFRIGFRNNIVTTGPVPASTQVQYKPARAGQRHFRIFLNDSVQTIAQTVLKDTTVNIVADHNYTVLLYGFARTGATPAMKLEFIDETVPDPGAQVALRVINTTGSAIDVRHYVSRLNASGAETGTPPAAPTWANVAPQSITSYVLVSPDSFRFNVQPAGGGAALFADARALIGAPPSLSLTNTPCGGTGQPKCDIAALPGTTIAGSAVTALIFPRSVAGSKARQFTTPAISFIWDRRPPRVPGT